MELTRNIHAFTIGMPGSWHVVIRFPGHTYQFSLTHVKLPDIVWDWK